MSIGPQPYCDEIIPIGILSLSIFGAICLVLITLVSIVLICDHRDEERTRRKKAKASEVHKLIRCAVNEALVDRDADVEMGPTDVIPSDQKKIHKK